MSKRLWFIASLLIISALALAACQPAATPTAAPQPPAEQPAQPPAEEPAQPPAEEPAQPPAEEPEEFVFGMLLVGPYNDRGWSQAHYDAGLYVEEKIPGTKMIYIDKVNPADRPGTTPAQLAEDLLSKGAKLIIFNSDDMKDSAVDFARAHPDVPVIHASGDTSWKEGVNYIEFPYFGNTMGEMEYGKMIAGCAAALTTQTGKIGYLGPLINDETRRLTASAYLGAKYCYEKYAQKDPADLQFRVTWIGFWFNIPGFTADPTQVADDFFNSGFDVVISGIDTTEALVQASKQKAAGKDVWAIPYDYEDACAEAPEVCLGVPYFNWGPAYVQRVQEVMNGTFKSYFEWLPPDWSDINNHDTSAIGFKFGDAISPEAKASVEQFIAELAGGLNLFVGPLNLQDGTPWLADGEVATDLQVWYLEQLLEGMEGQSVPSN